MLPGKQLFYFIIFLTILFLWMKKTQYLQIRLLNVKETRTGFHLHTDSELTTFLG